MADLSLGIDIGGSFTDIMVYDAGAGRHHIWKELTTPSDPAEGVVAAGKPYANMFFYNGGMGATYLRDGPTCLSWPSNVSSTPVEPGQDERDVLAGVQSILGEKPDGANVIHPAVIS